jgi:hypothetical protein
MESRPIASNQPRKANTAFEYFLYTAMVVETGLAAIVYKFIFGSGELSHLRIYFAIFYFAFLAWAIAQLNMLHKDRKTPRTEPVGSAPLTEAEPIRSDDDEPRSRSRNQPGPLGLTAAQLVIVVVVFATAVATFSWALRLLL